MDSTREHVLSTDNGFDVPFASALCGELAPRNVFSVQIELGFSLTSIFGLFGVCSQEEAWVFWDLGFFYATSGERERNCHGNMLVFLAKRNSE